MATFPERLLAWLNGALVWLSDLVMAPLAGLPPLVGLLLLSLATAAAMLPVIARTSDQARIRDTKRRLQAALFEIRLFNDDPAAVMRSLGDALRHNLVYLRLSLTPIVWLAVPLLLVVAQLQAYYGYRGLTPGVPELITVELNASAGTRGTSAPISLEAPPAIGLDTAAVHLPGAREVAWRIVPASDAAGEYALTFRAGADVIRKTVHVGEATARRSPRRVAPGMIDQWLYPSEPPLDDGAIDAIVIRYPEASLDVFGIAVHWTIVYLVLSMAWALLLARRWGITL